MGFRDEDEGAGRVAVGTSRGVGAEHLVVGKRKQVAAAGHRDVVG